MMADRPRAAARTAIVTGPTGLIGRAVVTGLRADGRRVVGVGLGDSQVVDGPDLVADLATDAGVMAATDVIRSTAELGLLVCNAGVTGPRRHPADLGIADWDAAQAINVRPVVALAAAAVQRWIADGVAGSIVTVSSPGAVRAHLHRAVYDATKGAVESFTRALAVDVGEYGIRVNAVVPAAVGDPDDPNLPLRRGATPEDVAAAVAFLASPAAAATTGHALAVDGGLLAQARGATVAGRAEQLAGAMS